MYEHKVAPQQSQQPGPGTLAEAFLHLNLSQETSTPEAGEAAAGLRPVASESSWVHRVHGQQQRSSSEETLGTLETLGTSSSHRWPLGPEPALVLRWVKAVLLCRLPQGHGEDDDSSSEDPPLWLL